MLAITSNPVDLVVCALIVITILGYVGLQFWLDRGKVQFSSWRSVLDEFNKKEEQK